MKISTFLIPAFLLLSQRIVHAQSWQWAESIGSANNSVTLTKISPFSGNRALVSGSFAAPALVFGNQILANAGQDDGFAALVDEAGQYVWAAGFGGSGRDFVTGAAAAPNGHYAVAGNYNSISINIGGTIILNSGATDAFIARYKPDNTLAWAQKIGTADIDEVSGVAMDADGNTYVSGQLQNKLSLITQHVFLRKYDANGSLVWEKKGINQGQSLQSTALAVDQNQNIFLCGRLWGTVSFDNTPLKCDTSYAAFIVKYSPSGSLAGSYINPNLDRINDVTAHGDALYCCAERALGCFGWGWPLSHSKTHLIKFDAGLNTVWHKFAGGEAACQSLDIAKGLSVDGDGNAYVTGYFFSDTLLFAGQVLPNPFNVNYYYPQIFVFKYSPDGEELWGQSFGGIHSDEGTGILATGDDQFYLGGNFESSPVAFGAYNLHNTSTLDSMYVHLSPSRYGRKTMSFLAYFDKTPSSVEPEPAFGEVLVFPNPATEHLAIRLKSPARSPLTLQISAPDGRVLLQSVYDSPVTELRQDLSSLSPGLYFATLRTANGRFSSKFIKI
jgi:hypothetical protein